MSERLLGQGTCCAPGLRDCDTEAIEEGWRFAWGSEGEG